MSTTTLTLTEEQARKLGYLLSCMNVTAEKAAIEETRQELLPVFRAWKYSMAPRVVHEINAD
jgi:hypothetical protein